MDDYKDRFYEELEKYYESLTKPVIKPWTSPKILEVIQHVKNAKVTMQMGDQRTTPETYWHLRYDVLKNGEEDLLIVKKDSPNCPTVRVVPLEDYYDTLSKVHKDCGHGGGLAKMQNLLKDKCIIATRAIELFLSLCTICESYSNAIKNNIGDYITHGLVELIDMQSVPDGSFKWILNYQDLNTKFVHLRPLCSKEASEAAYELFKIFAEFGVPRTLMSNYGLQFTAKIVDEIVQLWPECRILQCVPHYPQIQDSDESDDVDIENMVWTWMRDNKTAEWVTGCFFVQFRKNTSFQKDLGSSPFQALFRFESKEQPSTSQGKNTTMVTSGNSELHSTISSLPNVLQTSVQVKKAKKRNYTLRDTDTPKISQSLAKSNSLSSQDTVTPIVEAESLELYQESKKQKKSICQTESNTTKLKTKSPDLSHSIPLPENTPSVPTRKGQSLLDNETSNLETKIPEVSRPISPVYIPTSPPYQSQNSIPLPENTTSVPSRNGQSLLDTETSNSETKNPEVPRPISPVYIPTSPPYQSRYSIPLPENTTSVPSRNGQCSLDTETSNLETKSPAVSRPISPVYIPTSPPYQSRPSNSPSHESTKKDNDTAKSKLETKNSESASTKNVPLSPAYYPTSPPYQSRPSDSPSHESTKKDNDTAKSKLETKNSESASTKNVPLSPAYYPTSPPYQSRPSDSPSHESTKKDLHVNDADKSKLETQNSVSASTDKSRSPVYLPISPQYQSRYSYNTPEYATVSPSFYQNTESYHKAKDNDIGGVERILQYLREHLPTSAIDHLFINYAKTFKTFSPKVQNECKVELAKLFATSEETMSSSQ